MPHHVPRQDVAHLEASVTEQTAQGEFPPQRPTPDHLLGSPPSLCHDGEHWEPCGAGLTWQNQQAGGEKEQAVRSSMWDGTGADRQGVMDRSSRQH